MILIIKDMHISIIIFLVLGVFVIIFLFVIISIIVMISIINTVMNNGNTNMLYVNDFFIWRLNSAFKDLVIPQKGHGIENIFLKGQVI